MINYIILTESYFHLAVHKVQSASRIYILEDLDISSNIPQTS